MTRLACLAFIALGSASIPTNSAAASSDDAIAAKLMAPMSAVGRLIEDEKWSPLLDEMVQKAPAAAALGSRWTPQSSAWQKARRMLGARFARSADTYLKSDDMRRALQAALASNLPGEDAGVYATALNGPAGPTITRYEAMSAFVANVMSGSPREPPYGQPGWMERMSSLRQTFDDRVGAAVPREDPEQKGAAGKFLGEPIGRKGALVWASVVGRASLRIDGVINLMLFDDQEAIQRDVAEAASTAR